jgi:hypothetical protein
MFETRGESERILLLVQQPTSDLISSDSTVPIILLQQVDKLRKLENYLLTMVIALPPLSMLGWGEYIIKEQSLQEWGILTALDMENMTKA